MDEKKAKRTDMDQNGAEVRDMKKIKISIIVPVYNILEYLPRCVHSLTAQTYRNLEILLVDDGSTDGTEKLCDSLAKEDERIRVFHKKNGGLFFGKKSWDTGGFRKFPGVCGQR